MEMVIRLKKIQEFARERMAFDPTGHDYWHQFGLHPERTGLPPTNHIGWQGNI